MFFFLYRVRNNHVLCSHKKVSTSYKVSSKVLCANVRLKPFSPLIQSTTHANAESTTVTCARGSSRSTTFNISPNAYSLRRHVFVINNRYKETEWCNNNMLSNYSRSAQTKRKVMFGYFGIIAYIVFTRPELCIL